MFLEVELVHELGLGAFVKDSQEHVRGMCCLGIRMRFVATKSGTRGKKGGIAGEFIEIISGITGCGGTCLVYVASSRPAKAI